MECGCDATPLWERAERGGRTQGASGFEKRHSQTPALSPGRGLRPSAKRCRGATALHSDCTGSDAPSSCPTFNHMAPAKALRGGMVLETTNSKEKGKMR